MYRHARYSLGALDAHVAYSTAEPGAGTREQMVVGGASAAPRAKVMGIPSGAAGTIATLEVMKKLARDSIRAPDQMVRNKALEIFTAAGLPIAAGERHWIPQIIALQKFVQKSVRYVRDPVDVELVQSPQVTLTNRAGDCDDQATLLAALLVATGHHARFVAIGLNNEPFSHVLVETKVGAKWPAAETILDKPFGWYPQGVTSRFIKEVW